MWSSPFHWTTTGLENQCERLEWSVHTLLQICCVCPSFIWLDREHWFGRFTLGENNPSRLLTVLYRYTNCEFIMSKLTNQNGCHQSFMYLLFAENNSTILQHLTNCYRHILLKRLVCSIKVPDKERLRPTDRPNRWILKNKTDRLQQDFKITYFIGTGIHQAEASINEHVQGPAVKRKALNNLSMFQLLQLI